MNKSLSVKGVWCTEAGERNLLTMVRNC